MPALRSTLDELLASRPRPTAFFSSSPENCLSTLCHLLNAGLRVPDDAAIISGWDDLCLHHAIPSIAHYRADGAKAGRKLATMLLDLLRHGTGKLLTIPILPEFIPGGTFK